MQIRPLGARVLALSLSLLGLSACAGDDTSAAVPGATAPDAGKDASVDASLGEDASHADASPGDASLDSGADASDAALIPPEGSKATFGILEATDLHTN